MRSLFPLLAFACLFGLVCLLVTAREPGWPSAALGPSGAIAGVCFSAVLLGIARDAGEWSPAFFALGCSSMAFAALVHLRIDEPPGWPETLGPRKWRQFRGWRSGAHGLGSGRSHVRPLRQHNAPGCESNSWAPDSSRYPLLLWLRSPESAAMGRKVARGSRLHRLPPRGMAADSSIPAAAPAPSS